MDISIFNKTEYVEQLLKSAQFGLPVKMMLASALGVSPKQTSSMSYLENEILGLSEKFVPLKSSHTQSGDNLDEGGRPRSNDDELTPKGEETRNRESNSE